MMTAFVLLAVGLLAVLFEFFVPGGILGTIGALLVVASIIVFGLASSSFLLTLIYTFVTVALLVILIKVALWRIRHGKAGEGIYSDSDQEGYVASTWNRELVGETGVVSSDLRPGGHVTIGGKKYSSISQSGYIVKGTEIVVTGGEGESLMVKHHNKEVAS